MVIILLLILSESDAVLVKLALILESGQNSAFGRKCRNWSSYLRVDHLLVQLQTGFRESFSEFEVHCGKSGIVLVSVAEDHPQRAPCRQMASFGQVRHIQAHPGFD
jgi:hypothetical protein